MLNLTETAYIGSPPRLILSTLQIIRNPRNICAILVLLLLQCPCGLMAQRIIINEFMSNNESTLQDEDGDFSDWIELYNDENESVKIGGYSLTDNGDLDKWLFPDTSIQAKSYLLIFASGKYKSFSGELHTNFKISAAGEELFLKDSKGLIIDQTGSIALLDDQAYGRVPDGGINWTILFQASPGQSNNGNNQLLFSHDGGFYQESFYLRLGSILDDTIFYTVDGSIPTDGSNIFSDSLLLETRSGFPNYFSEIRTTPEQSLISYKAWESPRGPIDKANVIRCASFRNGKRSSLIYSQTYFIDDEIFDRYDLPVISLISDEHNLFSYDRGIYVPGKYYKSGNPEWSGNYFMQGEAWERPVHIEYYERDGTRGFSQNAGIRINGGKTRQAAQKSLRIYSRKEYGEEYFNYPLLPQKTHDKYQRFLLRTSMGAWGGQTIIKDVLAHEIVQDLNIENQDYQPVVVFLNGEYWGIHTIRDRIDEKYIAYQYPIDEDKVDLISNNYLSDNTGATTHYINLLNFIEYNDLSIEKNYEYLNTQMEMDNYIDYQISEMFFKNYDWPSNNMKFWRPNAADGRWRWIFCDLDGGFGNYDYNMFSHTTLDDEDVIWPNSPSGTFLFRNLLKSSIFKSQFISRYMELINEDFATHVMHGKLQKVKEMYDEEVPSHINRWNYPDSYAMWEDDIENDLATFIDYRKYTVDENLSEFFLLTDPIIDIDNDLNTGVVDKIVLAPNPNNGNFYIYNSSEQALSGMLTISSMTGKIVYVDDNLTLPVNERMDFNLGYLPMNIYLLKFYGSDFQATKKIVVIK